MQKLKNFTPAHPRIGLDRVFIKSPQLDPNKDYDVDETDKFENESINETNFIENLLMQNSQKLAKYKGEGCLCAYDEKIFDFPKNKIHFSDLLDILINDDNSEIELDKYKGKWIDSINQMIPIENLKSFSENLFKFDPLFPLNIQFESRFESGNLRMAIKVYDYEYDLIVNNDTNSGKASNWFYFRVTLRNTGKVIITEQPKTYKFNIINCQKTDTLFSKGLKVLCYSSTMKKWTRRTKNNYYFLNGITNEEKKLYTLTFTYAVDYNFSEENLYFAYCFPYSYTNLQNYLSSILNNSIISQKNILRHEIIGKSLSENNLDMIIITKFDCNFDEIAFRPCIVLTSRVHPGESNSSYVIQGVIDFLLDLKNPIAEKLRKNFIFKIIPMLNPDGVINGNFRTSLVGKDLNRLWDDPKENFCPTIFHTKEMIKKTLLSREVFLFCDFHGHSNKPNFFLYGCPTNRKLRTQLNLTYQEMILSRLYSGKNDMFDHRSCIYKIIFKKLKTARAVVKNELNIDFSYCLESSIGYISIGDNKFCFFTPKYYNKIGYDFCLSLNDLTNKEIFTESLQKIQAEEAAKNLNNNSNNNNQQQPIFNNYACHSNNAMTHLNSNSYFHTPNSNSYNNLMSINIHHNKDSNSNNNNHANNQSSNYSSTQHSYSQANLLSGNNTFSQEYFNNSKKNNQNDENYTNKSKKENYFNNREIKEKENKNTKDKEKEIFKHVSQNKEKNLNMFNSNGANNINNNSSSIINNKDKESLSYKNSKLLIKVPKDNSDISNNLETNFYDKEKGKLVKNKDKDRDREKDKDKEKEKYKEKNNNSKTDTTTTEKKSKKKKKKLNPLKTKKLFMASNTVDNPNNTSNSNNQNNSNIPSLSSSFLNLNSINTNIVDITKLPKNLAQINEKIKSHKPSTSMNTSNPLFLIKEHDHYSYSANKNETNIILNNNLKGNQIVDINKFSEDYVKKVNNISYHKKINDNISRERENSINSLEKRVHFITDKEVNRIANSSNRNFNNINEIKTNHDRTFSPDFHLKLNLEKATRNNFNLKAEQSENNFKNIFPPNSPNDQIISNLRNSINTTNNLSINNMINSISSNKNNHRKNIQKFGEQASEFISNPELIQNKSSSNKNLLYANCKERDEIINFNNKNFIQNNNDNNYYPSSTPLIKTSNALGGCGTNEINTNIANNNNSNFNGNALKSKNVYVFNNTSSEFNEKTTKTKSNNSKSIDPSKIYLTPTQKIYKTLNDNHILFNKHMSKNK